MHKELGGARTRTVTQIGQYPHTVWCHTKKYETLQSWLQRQPLLRDCLHHSADGEQVCCVSLVLQVCMYNNIITVIFIFHLSK